MVKKDGKLITAGILLLVGLLTVMISSIIYYRAMNSIDLLSINSSSYAVSMIGSIVSAIAGIVLFVFCIIQKDIRIIRYLLAGYWGLVILESIIYAAMSVSSTIESSNITGSSASANIASSVVFSFLVIAMDILLIIVLLVKRPLRGLWITILSLFALTDLIALIFAVVAFFVPQSGAQELFPNEHKTILICNTIIQVANCLELVADFLFMAKFKGDDRIAWESPQVQYMTGTDNLQNDDFVFCGKCGNKNSRISGFCRYCGNKLES